MSFTFAFASPLLAVGDQSSRTRPHCEPAAKTPVLILARHGQSTWNASGRVQGQLDEAELTLAGVAQAEALSRSISLAIPKEAQVLPLVSPLNRARQTYQHLASHDDSPLPIDPILDSRLLEAAFPWQGQTKDSLLESSSPFHETYVDWKLDPSKYRHSETGHSPLLELRSRADSFMRERSPPETPLTFVLAHNQTNRALLTSALKLPINHHFTFAQGNACINILRWDYQKDESSGGWTLVATNLGDEMPALLGNRPSLFPTKLRPKLSQGSSDDKRSHYVFPVLLTCGPYRKRHEGMQLEHSWEVAYEMPDERGRKSRTVHNGQWTENLMSRLDEALLTFHDQLKPKSSGLNEISEIGISADAETVSGALSSLLAATVRVAPSTSSLVWVEFSGDGLNGAAAAVDYLGLPHSSTRAWALRHLLDIPAE